MATLPLSNVIDPPPRLTGDAGQDTVAVIQWLNAFYVKGILSGGLLQPQNMDQSLISLGALVGAVDMLAYYTAEDVFDLTGFTAFARSLLDDDDAATARATLGAGTVTGVTGTAPIASSGGNAPDISIADFIGSGVTHARGAVPDPGAVAGTTKFLREDAIFAVPPGAGDVVGPVGATGNNVVLFDGATGKVIKDGGTLGTGAFAAAYALPTATSAVLGGVKPDNTSITNTAGAISVTYPLTAAPGTAAYQNVGAFDPAGAAAAVTPMTLGLVIGTNTQAYNAKLTSIASLASAAGWLHNDGAGAFTYSTPTASDVGAQPADADLTTWAGITPGANVGTALAVAVGTDGAFVVKGGVLGTPSSGNLSNCTAYPGTSALVTAGALNSGSITSGFGAIDIGADALTAGAINASGAVTATGGLAAHAANKATFSYEGPGNGAFLTSHGPDASTNGIVRIKSYRSDGTNGLTALTVASSGAIDVVGAFLAAGTIRPGGYTVGTLPAGTVGMKAYVTDALAPAYLVLLEAGGAAYSGAQYSGAQWVGD